MSIPNIENLTVRDKRVVVRVDFNVPVDKDTGEISDTTRIERTIPTLQYLLNKGASLVLISPFGRPKGKDASLSLKKVSEALQTLMPGNKVLFAGNISEESVKQSKALQPAELLLLENIRFYKEETSKEKAERRKLAELLAKHGDIYVDDAFGACHREHASIVELAELLPSYAGLLLKKEVEILTKVLSNPERPFVAVIGGAKVSSKIAVLENLIKKVNTILIGGGMAYTFLKSRALNIGNSMTEQELLTKAFQIIDKADYHKCEFILPEDHIAGNEFSNNAKTKTTGREIPSGYMGLDIGPKTIDRFTRVLKNAKTVLWNGPMGVFEMDKFSKGTLKIAKAISKVKGTTIVGGGDSILAVNQAGVADKMTHISTGGGATLEFLEGRSLPGVASLRGDEE